MKRRKAINFDLDTKKLQKYYPSKYYRNAYKDIARYLKKLGFEHKQYSGYVSKEEIDISEVPLIGQKITEKFEWLKYCVKEFDVTDVVDDTYSLCEIICNNNIIEHDKQIEEKKRVKEKINPELKFAKKNEYEIKKSLNKEKDFEL